MTSANNNRPLLLLLLITICLITILKGACDKDETLEPPLTLDQKYYEGFEEDLRNFPEPGTERIFEKIDFVGMPKNEVLELLGTPSNADVNGNLPPWPDAPLRYDAQGPDYIFHFRDECVFSVKHCFSCSYLGFSMEGHIEPLFHDEEGAASTETEPATLMDDQEIDFDSLYYEGCAKDRVLLQEKHGVQHYNGPGWAYTPCDVPKSRSHRTEVARRALRRMCVNIDFLEMPEQELLALLGEPDAKQQETNQEDVKYDLLFYTVFSEYCEGAKQFFHVFQLFDGEVVGYRREDFNEGRSCLFGPAFQDKMLDADYPGIEEDLIALRETYYDSDSESHLFTENSLNAARRLFRKANFFEMPLDELIEILGEPTGTTGGALNGAEVDTLPVYYMFYTGEKALSVHFECFRIVQSSDRFGENCVTRVTIAYDPNPTSPTTIQDEEIPANEHVDDIEYDGGNASNSIVPPPSGSESSDVEPVSEEETVQEAGVSEAQPPRSQESPAPRPQWPIQDGDMSPSPFGDEPPFPYNTDFVEEALQYEPSIDDETKELLLEFLRVEELKDAEDVIDRMSQVPLTMELIQCSLTPIRQVPEELLWFALDFRRRVVSLFDGRGSEVEPILIALTQDESPLIREFAAVAYYSWLDLGLPEALVALTDDESSSVRQEAYRTLYYKNVIITALNTHDGSVAPEYVEIYDELTPLLIKALSDPEINSSWTSGDRFRGLANRYPELVSCLLDGLKNFSTGKQRANAASSLRNITDDTSHTLLGIYDQDSEMRKLAEKERILDAIIDALRIEPDIEARKKMVNVLAVYETDGDKIIDVIKEMHEDPENALIVDDIDLVIEYLNMNM